MPGMAESFVSIYPGDFDATMQVMSGFFSVSPSLSIINQL